MTVTQRAARTAWRSVRRGYSTVNYAAARRRGEQLSLETIMSRHGSDKGTVHGFRPGLHVGHAYTDIYEPLSSSRRTEPIRMLEVGIGPAVVRPALFTRRHEAVRRRAGANTSNAATSTSWTSSIAPISAGIASPPTWLTKARARRWAPCSPMSAPRSTSSSMTAVASVHQQVTLVRLFPALADDGIYVIEGLDWQPPEPPDVLKTIGLLDRFAADETFPSTSVTPQERDDIEDSLVVESTHRGSARHPGAVEVLRRRHPKRGG